MSEIFSGHVEHVNHMRPIFYSFVKGCVSFPNVLSSFCSILTPSIFQLFTFIAGQIFNFYVEIDRFLKWVGPWATPVAYYKQRVVLQNNWI